MRTTDDREPFPVPYLSTEVSDRVIQEILDAFNREEAEPRTVPPSLGPSQTTDRSRRTHRPKDLPLVHVFPSNAEYSCQQREPRVRSEERRVGKECRSRGGHSEGEIKQLKT